MASYIEELHRHLARLKAQLAVYDRKDKVGIQSLTANIVKTQELIKAVNAGSLDAARKSSEERAAEAGKQARERSKRSAASFPGQQKSQAFQLRAQKREEDKILRAEQEARATLLDPRSRRENWNSTGLLNWNLDPHSIETRKREKTFQRLPDVGGQPGPSEAVLYSLARVIIERKNGEGLTAAQSRSFDTQLAAIHDTLAERLQHGEEEITEGRFIDEVVNSGLKTIDGRKSFNPITAGIWYRLKRFESMSPTMQGKRHGGQVFIPGVTKTQADHEDMAQRTFLAVPPPGSNDFLGDYDTRASVTKRPGDKQYYWERDELNRRQRGAAEVVPGVHIRDDELVSGREPGHVPDPRSVLGMPGIDTVTGDSGDAEGSFLGNEIMNFPGTSDHRTLAEKLEHMRKMRRMQRSQEFVDADDLMGY